SQPQPLRQVIERLSPYRELLPGTYVLAGNHAFQVGCYLVHGLGQAFDYGLLQQRPAGQTLEAFLESRAIGLVYLDDDGLLWLRFLNPAGCEPFLGNGDGRWKRIAGCDVPGDRWRLFRHTP